MVKWEKKFYVIRKWKETGIFPSREECKLNVNWFPDAKYKSFSSIELAKQALEDWWEKYYSNWAATKNKDMKKMNNDDKNQIIKDIPFFYESIAVDAACTGNPWKMEYRWIDLKTGEEIFHEKFEIWTNNIGEFLAIVNGLQFLQWNRNTVIYSDSKIAISRVNQWKCKTKFSSEWYHKITEAIINAENWLQQNWITHKILKWDTGERWEIPADFGRK